MTINNPHRQARNTMTSPRTAPVTYALGAVNALGDSSKGWNLTAGTFQVGTEASPPRILSPTRDKTFSVSSRRDAVTGLTVDARPYEIVNFTKSGTDSGSVNAGVLFAIVPRAFAVPDTIPWEDNLLIPDSVKASSAVKNNTNFRGFAPNSAFRGIGDSLSGIIVSTFGNGDDVVMPQGGGSLGVGSYTRSQVNTLLYDWNKVLIDRGKTFANIRNGDDVVIGGYGSDYMGAVDISGADQNGSISLSMLSDVKRKGTSNYSGSKLLVGGSSDDLLNGANSDDYLVGDRFAGNELYLPSDAINGANLSAAFKNHISNINLLQPQWYRKQGKWTGRLGSEKLGISDFSVGYFSNSYEFQPLWMPGNDIIRGYSGNDTIFGDNNTITGINGSYVDLLNIKSFFEKKDLRKDDIDRGAYSKSNWDKGDKLGADFIDAGPGNDFVYAGFGGDAVIGGTGSDLINLGDQIVAPNYRPFWGTKIAYGDNFDFARYSDATWQSTENQRSPDIFLIGNLIQSEDDMKSSDNVDGESSLHNIKTLRDSVEEFDKNVKTFGGLVKALPKIGGALSGILSGFAAMLKAAVPKAPAIPPDPARANDYLNIINDFDKSDQLLIRVPIGATINVNYQGFRPSEGDIANPLVQPYTQGGVVVSVGYGDKSINRVFLPGYKEGLAFLNQDLASGFFQLGGSDFAGTYGGNTYTLISSSLG